MPLSRQQKSYAGSGEFVCPQKTCAFIISDFIDMTVWALHSWAATFVSSLKDSTKTAWMCHWDSFQCCKMASKTNHSYSWQQNGDKTNHLVQCRSEWHRLKSATPSKTAIDKKWCKQLYVLVSYEMFFTYQIFCHNELFQLPSYKQMHQNYVVVPKPSTNCHSWSHATEGAIWP